MKKNMGNTDRMIRIAVAAVVAVLLFTKVITGIFAIVLAVLAAVFVLTSVVSICPLYSIVGLSTCPVKERA
jgi:chromate transport protein ChrA